MLCKICGKPLQESQYSEDRKYKSCPRCSAINGVEHIYFSYPEEFGTTEKRESINNPDGPQSYCVMHRSNNNASVPTRGIECRKIKGKKKD